MLINSWRCIAVWCKDQNAGGSGGMYEHPHVTLKKLCHTVHNEIIMEWCCFIFLLHFAPLKMTRFLPISQNRNNKGTISFSFWLTYLVSKASCGVIQIKYLWNNLFCTISISPYFFYIKYPLESMFNITAILVFCRYIIWVFHMLEDKCTSV